MASICICVEKCASTFASEISGTLVTAARLSSVCMEVADKRAQGRVVSVLEGGYDLEGLSQSTAAHVVALMRG